MRLEGLFRVRIVKGLLFGEMVAYLLAILANGAVFFHFLDHIPERSLIALFVAKALGHNICLNFAILFVLPQRNSIWVPIFGVSIERMIKYHRIMGRILFVAISAHLTAFWVHWITHHHIFSASVQTTNLHGQSYAFMTTSIIGHSAWLCVFVILISLITSLEYVRRTKFELFFNTHHLFLAVIGLGIYHTYLTQRFSGDNLLYWLAPGTLMYTADILIRRWRSRKQTHLVSVVRDQGTNILLVKLQRYGFKFQPGQYVYINFPQVSYFQWHPFSITSAPSESQTRDTIVSLAIRNMGRKTWTGNVHKLLEETLLPENIKVKLDGPYGALSIDLYKYPLRSGESYPILVLVAGGIGIAPLISILNEYHNNPSLAFDKMYFMWCAKHRDYLAPFARDTLQDIENNDMLGKLEIHRYATRDLESACRPSLVGIDTSQRGLSLNGRYATPLPEESTPGRPVLRDFFGRLVHRHPKARIGVVVCGPKVMADDVAHTCNYFNKVHRPQIDLHRESFEV